MNKTNSEAVTGAGTAQRFRDRDQYKAHAQALAEALQRLYASDPYASPDFYMKASDNAKAKLAAWKARGQ